MDFSGEDILVKESIDFVEVENDIELKKKMRKKIGPSAEFS